ncbi:protein phosphatase regulator [Colletotrichum higginsianum]|nr:protein phosphatase regulator [Colletotrichum higginsianum]
MLGPRQSITDSDTEYPFLETNAAVPHPPYEWDCHGKHPVDTPIRKSLPVWLSPDQKNLWAPSQSPTWLPKSVTCRFTLDYWKTTSEVGAEYSHEIRPQRSRSHDRFTFTIKLSDLANLETKTLFFCIRYNVNGQDSGHNGINFQVDFRKNNPALALPLLLGPIPGRVGPHGGLRLKVNKSTGNLASDNLSSRLTAPSGQAFANRYDFGASLTAPSRRKGHSVKDRNPDISHEEPPQDPGSSQHRSNRTLSRTKPARPSLPRPPM